MNYKNIYKQNGRYVIKKNIYCKSIYYGSFDNLTEAIEQRNILIKNKKHKHKKEPHIIYENDIMIYNKEEELLERNEPKKEALKEFDEDSHSSEDEIFLDYDDNDEEIEKDKKEKEEKRKKEEEKEKKKKEEEEIELNHQTSFVNNKRKKKKKMRKKKRRKKKKINL